MDPFTFILLTALFSSPWWGTSKPVKAAVKAATGAVKGAVKGGSGTSSGGGGKPSGSGGGVLVEMLQQQFQLKKLKI